MLVRPIILLVLFKYTTEMATTPPTTANVLTACYIPFVELDNLDWMRCRDGIDLLV